MSRRPTHCLPYETHQWLGELLWQARDTLLHAGTLVGNAYPKTAMTPLRRIVSTIDTVRSAMDTTLCAEHRSHAAANDMLHVYYPGHGLSHAWHRRHLGEDTRVLWHHGGRTDRLHWEGHLFLAELLFQGWAMLWDSWKITLPVYGASDKTNRLLERLVPSGTALTTFQVWCQDRLYDAVDARRIPWPPELGRDVYTNGARHFTPWHVHHAPVVSGRSAARSTP